MLTMSGKGMFYPKPFGSNHFGERTIDILEGIVSDPETLLQDSRAITKLTEPAYKELDILSADRYPGAPTQHHTVNQKKKRKHSETFYGGIYLNDEVDNPSSHSSSDAIPKTVPTKQSKRSSRKIEEDMDHSKTKQRGRPRLDTQDETAADRRRTQIRLAQRAYRHRKETTISGLKKKVSMLEKTIENMNKSVVQINDNFFDSGILSSHPALADQLRTTADQCAALARSAIADSDAEEEASKIENLQRDHTGSVSSGQAANPPVSLNLDSTVWGYNPIEEEVEQVVMEETPVVAENTSAKSYADSRIVSSKLWPIPNRFQQYNAEFPNLQAFNEMKLSSKIERPLQAAGGYTYSFQETTLARRLHRLCIERAFRNLTNPYLDPEYIERAFRFTFCFSNKKKMLMRFQDILKRKAGESLENWNAPYFHIGGAGLHFPRRDEQGNPIYPPNIHPPAKAFGPHMWKPVETPRENETVEQILESIGFGGDWFDSHDVEEYLKTKGIYIDGQTSFFEIDPSSISLPQLTTSSSPSSHSEVSLTHASPAPKQFSTFEYDEVTLERELQEIFGPQGQFLLSEKEEGVERNAWDETLNASGKSPGYTPTYQEILNRRQSPVTVDVGKFLDRLIEGSACLGRAPGFRRQHVDNALALAIQEAF